LGSGISPGSEDEAWAAVGDAAEVEAGGPARTTGRKRPSRVSNGRCECLDKEGGLEEVNKMPFGDGTGPAGLGPMTGRAAGYCAGYPVPGFMNPIPGRGWGRGFGGGWGRGRGWRHGYYATGLPGWARGGAFPFSGAAPYVPYGAPAAPFAYGGPYAPQVTREQQLDLLKGQAEYLEDTLEGIRKQMEEVEAEPKKEEK
jgi:hypothetical protein